MNNQEIYSTEEWDILANAIRNGGKEIDKNKKGTREKKQLEQQM